MARCRHVQSRIIWIGIAQHPTSFSRHCQDCGERLSIGPSNDEGCELDIEVAEDMAFISMLSPFAHPYVNLDGTFDIILDPGGTLV